MTDQTLEMFLLSLMITNIHIVRESQVSTAAGSENSVFFYMEVIVGRSALVSLD